MQPSVGTAHVFDNPAELSESVTRSFVDLAESAIQQQGVFRVALSGGSTPQRLYELLAQSGLPWDKIQLYWGDERNVPHDDPQSNFLMVKRALIDPAGVPETSVFAVPTAPENPAAAATAYQQILRDQFPDSDWPDFDLVLLGIGDDAHTASLFPQTTALHETQRWFVDNRVEKLETTRLTLTAPAINAAANIWFMIAGEKKRQALANVWGPTRNVELFPSQLIRPEDGVLWWMVSSEAMPTAIRA
jgi:6-phosphogluconolactonase